MTFQRRYPNGPIVFGVANEGGGTRKTTSAVNLAVAIAREGRKVALLDADQTMACSCYCGYGVTRKKDFPERAEEVYARLSTMPNVYEVLHDRATLQEAMVPARTRIDNNLDRPIGDDDDSFEVIENLWLVLGSREMAQASDDIRSPRLPAANNDWLRRAVYGLPEGLLDVLVVDFRGTYDTLEATLLAACDFIVGAVKPDSKDEDTLELLRANIRGAQETFRFSGGSAELAYVLINGTMKNRGQFYIDILDGLTSYFDGMLLPTISESVNVAESVEAQEPVHYWLGPDSKPAQEFTAAAKAIKQIWV